MGKQYYGAEVSKLAKQMLIKAFPNIKFSVRYKSYSGGSSIDVNWDDGPRQKSVERIVGHMHNRDFDGMQDLSYYIPSDFHVSYIFCNRHLSDKISDRYAERIGVKFGKPIKTYDDISKSPDWISLNHWWREELNRFDLDAEGNEIWTTEGTDEP